MNAATAKTKPAPPVKIDKPADSSDALRSEALAADLERIQTAEQTLRDRKREEELTRLRELARQD